MSKRFTLIRVIVITGLISLLPIHSVQAQTLPYQPSAIITGVTFNTSSIQTQAPGSDNWPITWAADGNLYTSWGDGGGFGGTNTDGRVSLGFGRISSTPPNITTVNIFGGKNSQCNANISGKTYGMVDINGILYAWISPGSNNSNYQSTTLYKSTNLGCTWITTGVAFTQNQNLILPSILQFGAGYSNTFDNYVYIYATRLKNASALTKQQPGEIDLLRVPKGQITNQASYEFFKNLNTYTPVWTSDINQRQPVFSVASGVGWAPPGVIYNPDLNRFLLTIDDFETGLNGVSGKGFGIYDAPAPWGPWTTVKRFSMWDFEPSFFYHFSPKWITNQGKTLYLVFSGTGTYDSFNLIRADFTLGNQLPTSPTPTATITPTPTGAACIGDITGDQVVSVQDLVAILSAWGQTNSPANIDGQGGVDVGDLLLLLAHWGACP